MEKSTAAWHRHIQDVVEELVGKLDRGEITEEEYQRVISELKRES